MPYSDLSKSLYLSLFYHIKSYDMNINVITHHKLQDPNKF